uniref:PQ-loop repeat-containing protein 1 n=1 Tax=Timema bartmani TaxID=61472 RepID=A0A7R9HVN1_9NEOP|nr:unnamed protein product [Timema bartmani]
MKNEKKKFSAVHMTAYQLVPVLVCVSVSDFDKHYFWAWTDFMSYIDFMLLFTIGCSLLMYLFIEHHIFVQTVGFLAVLTEALLGAPQLLRNLRNKSTEGMRQAIYFVTGPFFVLTRTDINIVVSLHTSRQTPIQNIKMVVMWMMGDTFKTAYFIFNDLPLQFWLCGCLQVFIDIIILFQVYLYRQNIGVRSKKQDVPD